MERNLICLKWGTAYGPEYVINLYQGATRHSTVPFNFHVFTDDASLLPSEQGWIIHLLPDLGIAPNKAWFYKLCLFDSDNNLQGRNIYIDLDCVILKDLADMWKYETNDFVICRDYNRVYQPSFQGVNSSVMAWNYSTMSHLHGSFLADPISIMSRHRGDQDFIDSQLKTKVFWPDAWTRSYRWECWRGGIIEGVPNRYAYVDDITIIPDETKILVFHGKPKPHEIEDIEIKRLWTGS